MTDVPTRQRMIETAVRLFQQQGYHATSWRTLVDEAGTPWGSAHHHFPGGKEQLGIAAIELGAAAVGLQIEQMLTGHKTPAAAIRAWYHASAEQLARSGYTRGCPIATVALETAATSPALAAACKRAFDGWAALIAERLVRAGIKRKRAAELATLAVVNLEGALLLARLSRAEEPVTAAGDHVAAAIEAAGPATAR